MQSRMAGQVGTTKFIARIKLINYTVELGQKAVRTTIAIVSGGYQTALVSYFINRDFFPASMKVRNRTQQYHQV